MTRYQLGLGLNRRRKARFSPLALPGLQVFVDPSDLSTMFQDGAGAIPVNSPGDPVGLALSKDQGLRRGPELWQTADAAPGGLWTEDGGAWTKASTGNSTMGLTTLSAGTWYEWTFTITATTGVLNLWRRDSNDTNNEQAASNFGTGTHTVIVQAGPAANGDGQFLWFDGNAFTGSVDTLSMKALAGNHVLAPSDAARPVYQTGGGLSWLEFDGVDDVLQAALSGIGSDHSVVVGARPTAVKNGNDSTFSIDASNDYQMNAGSGTQYFGNCTATNLGIGTLNNAADLVGTDVVQRISLDSVTGEAQLAYNGGVVDTSPAYNGLISPSQTLRIAANRAGVNFLECRVYSLVMLSSTPDLSNLEQWIAAKSGAAL